jgi:ferritin
MLSKKIQEALNAQINAEYYSSYLYLSMAAYCDSMNLKGMGHWFEVQGSEEMIHVMKFFRFVLDRKGTVELKAIQGPPTQWKSPLAAFEASAAHEAHVTGLINNLVALAQSENDFATVAFLQWFVNEQVEEEASVDAVVQQLKLADGTPAALFMIDRELGARVATAAADAGTAT